MSENRPIVVIVGAGVGGLAAARALKHVSVRVVVVDRCNHHVCQPLLYQVATSVLAPGAIATPIRGMLRRNENTTVILGTVVGVDVEAKNVIVNLEERTAVPIHYDYLIVATGMRESYFGHDEFRSYASGLKTLADAVAIRNKILMAFEMAEASEEPTRRKQLLTFVVVGAGPTGVEMAIAIAVLTRSRLKRDFRRADPSTSRIVLVDSDDRVLGTFAPELSADAQVRLERLGVELLLGKAVERIGETGVTVGGQHIESKTVIWAGGVAPSPAGKWLNTATDKDGRVRVCRDLSVRNLPEAFVVGDTAYIEQDGQPLAGLARVALQQGRYAARVISARIADLPSPPPFRYNGGRSLAVSGKGFGVLQTGKAERGGFRARFMWAATYVQYLAVANLPLSVFVPVVWRSLVGWQGERLILKRHKEG